MTDDTRELLAELIATLLDRFSSASTLAEAERNRGLCGTLFDLRARLAAPAGERKDPEWVNRFNHIGWAASDGSTGDEWTCRRCGSSFMVRADAEAHDCQKAPPGPVEEVTEDMLDAGKAAYRAHGITHDSALRNAYRAMRAAAQPKVTDEVVERAVKVWFEALGWDEAEQCGYRKDMRRALEAVWPR